MAYPIYKENFSDTLRWLLDSENKQTARKSAKRPMIENASRGLLQRKVNPDKEMQRKKQQSMKVTEEKVKVPKWKYPKQTHRFCSPNCVQKIDSDPHTFHRSHISAYFIPLLYGWTRLVGEGNILILKYNLNSDGQFNYPNKKVQIQILGQ